MCYSSSGASRMDAMLQMRSELQSARLVTESRADELRLRMDALRIHMTSLRNEIDPPAPAKTTAAAATATRKAVLPSIRQKQASKKAPPSKLGT